MSIIISQKGINAKVVTRSDFENEDYLQNYIHKNPESIPLYDIAEDRKLFIVKREFPTNSGQIDALAIDQAGGLYIIETKLYKNPDKRLVVAQALDYGAALWKHLNDFDKFINIIREEIESRFRLSIEEKIEDFFDLEDGEIEDLFTSLKNNLGGGNVKFVILMDKIDERLKDLILYVNSNSKFDIYAVQFEYYKHEDFEIIIPKMFGVDVRKDITRCSISARHSWNRDSFLEAIQKLSPGTQDKINFLLDFTIKENCLGGWGTGQIPSLYFKIPSPVQTGKKITVFNVWGDGHIQVGYWLKPLFKNHHDIIRTFYTRANAIEGISVDENQTRQFQLPIDKISLEGLNELKQLVIWLKNQF